MILKVYTQLKYCKDDLYNYQNNQNALIPYLLFLSSTFFFISATSEQSRCLSQVLGLDGVFERQHRAPIMIVVLKRSPVNAHEVETNEAELSTQTTARLGSSCFFSPSHSQLCPTCAVLCGEGII